MCVNHDCQYLFTQTHVLAIVYSIMKYISKAKTTIYSKLTIVVVVAKTFTTTSKVSKDVDKTMLIKTYNKLINHREIGHSEIISHLLDFPDHFTDVVFFNIHTTHLFKYLKYSGNDSQEISGDSTIVRVQNKTIIVLSFDDYTYRESLLINLCLYDYCSLVIKIRKQTADCHLN